MEAWVGWRRRKAGRAAHLAQRAVLCQGGFSPRGWRHTRRFTTPSAASYCGHGSASRHPHRLPLHQDHARGALREIRDRRAHGQARPRAGASRRRPSRAGAGDDRQRRRVGCADGLDAAAVADLLLRHGLRAHRSRRRPQAQHHGDARRRRQRARRGRDGLRHPARLDATDRARRQDDPPRRLDQAHPQPVRRHRRPDRRQARHPGPRHHRHGVRQARQGLRRRDRLLQQEQAQRCRLCLFPQRDGAGDLGRLPDRLPALGRLQPAHHQCRRAEGTRPARTPGEHQPRLGGRRGGARRGACATT